MISAFLRSPCATGVVRPIILSNHLEFICVFSRSVLSDGAPEVCVAASCLTRSPRVSSYGQHNEMKLII